MRKIIIANYYLAGLLLLIAGVMKIGTPKVSDLLQVLFDKGLVSSGMLVFIVNFQPIFEIVVGGFAISGWYSKWSAKVLIVIYSVFALVILYASDGYLTVPLDCGCFGETDSMPVYLLLLRNITIAIMLFFY